MYQKTLWSLHLWSKECKRNKDFSEMRYAQNTGRQPILDECLLCRTKYPTEAEHCPSLQKTHEQLGHLEVSASLISMPASTTASSQQVAHKPVASD